MVLSICSLQTAKIVLNFPKKESGNKEPRSPSKTQELFLRMLVGGGCGFIADSVTNLPLVLQTRKFASDAAKIPSTGILSAAHKLIKTEGIRGCYSGFPVVASASFIGTGGYCVGSRVTRECLGEGNLANLAAGYGGQMLGSLLAWTKGAVISEIQQAPQELKDPKFINKGAIEIASLIIKEQGVLALYRGLGIQLFNFGTANGFGEYFAGILRKKMSGSDSISGLSLSQQFVINAVSWGGASALTTPLGVFKLRVQLNGMSQKHFPDSSSLQCAKRVWKTQGIQGLYAGTTARVFAIAPRAAIFFTGMPHVYDALCKKFNFKTPA